jgi:acyl-coenzyme A thioesterase 13
MGNLHGGCCATIFDWATTTALVPISNPGFWLSLGVSRTLNVTYLRPVPKDEVVTVESEIVQIGKRICTTPNSSA